MEFPLGERSTKNKNKYAHEAYMSAVRFSEKLYKEFGRMVRCVALFGSSIRGDKQTNDIDILVVMDDTNIMMTQEFVEGYRIIVEKIVRETSRKLHITSLKFTSFWEYIRAGDPLAINILRDGVPLIDTGFFEPLQVLLHQGRIRPSPESIWAYYGRAPATLNNANWHILQAHVDLYWAVIDSAHAALMHLGEIPPSPNHIADLLEEKLVRANLLKPKYVNTMRKFFRLQKDILTKNITAITGVEYDQNRKEAMAFVDEIHHIIDRK